MFVHVYTEMFQMIKADVPIKPNVNDDWSAIHWTMIVAPMNHIEHALQKVRLSSRLKLFRITFAGNASGSQQMWAATNLSIFCSSFDSHLVFSQRDRFGIYCTEFLLCRAGQTNNDMISSLNIKVYFQIEDTIDDIFIRIVSNIYIFRVWTKCFFLPIFLDFSWKKIQIRGNGKWRVKSISNRFEDKNWFHPWIWRNCCGFSSSFLSLK